MHNGQVASFATIRRMLEASLPDDLYHARRGTTDSELLFLLLLAKGLTTNPQTAFETVISMIRAVQGHTNKPNRITSVASDGQRIYAMRHSCDEKSPTLYLSEGLDNGGRAFASEPLDGCRQRWSSVAENHFVCLSADRVIMGPLTID